MNKGFLGNPNRTTRKLKVDPKAYKQYKQTNLFFEGLMIFTGVVVIISIAWLVLG